ncbi:MAG TPA: glucosyl-3-phosphoglycerate synthase [Solirubrobacteraceae bacterium]|jgi:glycosyltransferase involved in cell wall biosynthesis|nr:glucosyl-3-phosphoglycerate synthase [Solirubrobacteraceae bacterium]
MTRLAAPEDELLACVVVPAHNEEDLIAGCLRALGHQRGIAAAAYEVILVLDACTDSTPEVALMVGGEFPSLRLHLRHGPGRGAGAARKLGMDLAAARLLSLGRGDGLIASTDADSAVAPGWLAAQLAAVSRGARAIGGRVELFPADAERLRPEVLDRRAARAAVRHAAVRPPSDASEHWQFSGASMSLTAATYLEIGGLDPHVALEDEGLQRSLQRNGIPIERRLDVRVATSGRLNGRATRGLAHDLALDDWLTRRTYDTRATIDDLLAIKDHTISLVLPTRNVGDSLDGVLDALGPSRDAGLIDEILIVDAASNDATRSIAATHGVTLLQESALLPEFGPALGKGDALWRGLNATHGEIVAFLDTDTRNFSARFLLDLVAPLLGDPRVHFVKGAFRRPFTDGDQITPDGGGRVTEILARPLLNLHLPDLAGFAQPLAGEVAGRRDLLETLSFPVGYGVEIAMLIDAYRKVGRDGLAQAQLGLRENRHQPLDALGAMAYQVLVAAQRRIHGPDAIDQLAPGTLLQPAGVGLEPRALAVEERPPLRTLRPAHDSNGRR